MILENIKKIEDKIFKSCSKCGRDINEIKLIAVSKRQPVSAIREALQAGVLNFGENKAQEVSDKAPQFGNELFWHFIGHLQRNKVKYIIESSELIHSVESVKLADEIQKRAKSVDKIQNVLLEINTSGEESKFGLTDFSDIMSLAEYCSELPNVNLSGLMTMAPYTDDEKIIRKTFSDLRKLKEKINSVGFRLKELSMGMTNDYEIAIEEGATLIRVGTAIFGERKY